MITARLDTSRKLRDKGFRQETKFKWYDAQGGNEPLTIEEATDRPWYATGCITCAAPTAEEIADQLPDRIELSNGETTSELRLQIQRNDKEDYEHKGWHVGYYGPDLCCYENDYEKLFTNAYLAEALAECWLWCVEQGHIKETK